MSKNIFNVKRLSAIALLLLLAACTRRKSNDHFIEITPLQSNLKTGSTKINLSDSEQNALNMLVKQLKTGQDKLNKDAAERPAVEITVVNTDCKHALSNARIAHARAHKAVKLVKKAGWNGPIAVKFTMGSTPSVIFSATTVDKNFCTNLSMRILSDLCTVYGVSKADLMKMKKSSVKKPSTKAPKPAPKPEAAVEAKAEAKADDSANTESAD